LHTVSTIIRHKLAKRECTMISTIFHGS
jgi:hypothetical protein